VLRQFSPHRPFATARSHFPEKFRLIPGKTVLLGDILSGMEIDNRIDAGLNKFTIAQTRWTTRSVHLQAPDLVCDLIVVAK
jgi:hypothetical protein